jgi:hypothetical protein
VARKTAAQQLEKVDGMMRIILADLAENASRLNEWWSEASVAIRSDPDRALESLIEAEISPGDARAHRTPGRTA